ncbi:MAG TPA: hypothetical protein PK733_19045, partial [Clostridiales bacterium]|nr:hypothetical protein [Clostridiales bacterium]
SSLKLNTPGFDGCEFSVYDQKIWYYSISKSSKSKKLLTAPMNFIFCRLLSQQAKDKKGALNIFCFLSI